MKKLPSTNLVGVVKWPTLRRYKAIAKNHPKYVLIICLLVMLLVTTGIYLYWQNRPKSQLEGAHLVPGNGYAQTIDKLENQVPPADAMDQVFYYSQLAQSYEALERYDKSLEYYLQGQRIIDAQGFDEQVSFYTPISDCYAKLRQQDKAADYRKKADDRVQHYKNATPDLPQRVEMKMETQ